MKIIEKLAKKNNDIFNAEPVTIAFLGDSVTQGCFECFINEEGNVDTVFDRKSAYSSRLCEILQILYPRAHVNIINAGISGDNAINGLDRYERDVGKFNPDLVVVAFALNDSGRGREGLEDYTRAVGCIIDKVKKSGAECIILTPNFKQQKSSCHISDPILKKISEDIDAGCEILKLYVEAEKKVAINKGVKICDVFSAWEKMYKGGVDVTGLLANYINHPVRDLHYYTAVKITETFFE